MKSKKITLCLALSLCFTTEHTLKASISTKTIITTVGVFLLGGLLLWKKTYIKNYLLYKVFNHTNSNKNSKETPLLSNGINANSINCDLYKACENYDIEAIKKLLSHPNIDPNINISGKTPLYIAVKKGSTTMTKFLLNHPKIDPTTYLNYYLKKSFKNDMDDIAKLILDHPKINHDDISLCSYIRSQERLYKKINFIKLLLSYPSINTNIKDKDSYHTPLTLACAYELIPIIKLLLANPATDPNISTGKDSNTPLTLSLNSLEIVKLLLIDPRINPNIGMHNYVSHTPLLSNISFFGNTQQIKLLLDHPKIKDAIKEHYYPQKECSDAFLDACLKNKIDLDTLAQIFDTLNIDINHCNRNNDTALHIACSKNNMPLLYFLLTKTPNIHIKNNNGLTPLLIAATKNISMINALLMHGACISNEDCNGQTVFYYAYKNKIVTDINHFFWKETDNINHNNFLIRELHIAEKQFYSALPCHLDSSIEKEKIYHSLLCITPYYPDEKLYTQLKTNLLVPDVCKKIIGYYKLITIDRDIVQQKNYKYGMNNTEKNNFNKNFFATYYEGLLPYLPSLNQLSICS